MKKLEAFEKRKIANETETISKNVHISVSFVARVPFFILKIVIFGGNLSEMCIYGEKRSPGYPIFRKIGVPWRAKTQIYAHRLAFLPENKGFISKKGYPGEQRHKYTHTAYFM